MGSEITTSPLASLSAEPEGSYHQCRTESIIGRLGFNLISRRPEVFPRSCPNEPLSRDPLRIEHPGPRCYPRRPGAVPHGSSSNPSCAGMPSPSTLPVHPVDDIFLVLFSLAWPPPLASMRAGNRRQFNGIFCALGYPFFNYHYLTNINFS